MNEEVKILLHLQLSYFISDNKKILKKKKKCILKKKQEKKIPNSTTRVSTKGD